MAPRLFFAFLLTFLFPLLAHERSLSVSLDHPERFYKILSLRFRGNDICFITNQAASGKYLMLPGKTKVRSQMEEYFRNEKSLVKKVFTPEHGLTSMEEVEDKSRVRKRIRFYNLYQKTQGQMRSYFRGCTDLVFDLPDVGVRPYTYRTILTRSLQAVSEMKNAPRFILIDRPNPASYLGVFGPVAKSKYFSFLGEEKIAFFPGYTYAELARYYLHSGKMKPDIVYVRMIHYDPHRLPERSILLPPSPNLPDDRALHCYWMGIFLEATSLDYGRNSNDPFCTFGHPAFRHSKNMIRLPGIKLIPFQYKPSAGPHKGKLINGYRIIEINLKTFRPDKAAYFLLQYLLKEYPHERFLVKYKKVYKMDWITGSSSLRTSLLNGEPYYKWKNREAKNIARFRSLMEPYRLY